MALTSRGLLRLFLFLGGYITFLVLGASIFSAIESPEEAQKVQNLRKLRSDFLKSHPTVTEEIELSKEAARIRYENAPQDTFLPNNSISLAEAMQILSVEKVDPVQVEKRFKMLFESNQKSKGGSFYLQSKIVRAKQRLDAEIQQSSLLQKM